MVFDAVVRFDEHPQHVLSVWSKWNQTGGASLVVVTATEGGGVRSRGSMMAVSRTGDRAGYISGGCIDADVAKQAQAAMADGIPRKLRYGAGSPFLDLPLPCGGAIEVMILPRPDATLLDGLHHTLARRRSAGLAFSDAGQILPDPEEGADFVFRYVPKLRLRIAGRGADVLALARLAEASGIETVLQLRDDDIPAALGEMYGKVSHLASPRALPPSTDDRWTAFVLAFHDPEWELPLLQQALAGPAFFIGAVGSSRTHARRCGQLRELGVQENDIAKIRAPVGLLPSMRDASMLAISVLAQIAADWHGR